MSWKLNTDGTYTHTGTDTSNVVNSSGANENKTGAIKNNPSDTSNAIKNTSKNETNKQEYDVFGSGSAKGDYRIRKGDKVVILGLGNRFNGGYLVIETKHTISSAGYKVDFEVGAKKQEIPKDNGKDNKKGNGNSSSESSKDNGNNGHNKPEPPVSDNRGSYRWKLGADGVYRRYKV